MQLPQVHVSRRTLFSYALIAVVIGTVLGGVIWNISSNYLTFRGFITFSSELEMADFLNKDPTSSPKSLYERLVTAFKKITRGDTSILLEGASTPASQTLKGGEIDEAFLDYSTTNIQVEGVDEADIVKTDGLYIYTASGSNVFIINAIEPTLLSQITLENTVVGLFAKGNKLVVIQQSSDSDIFYNRYYYYEAGDTSIFVYDVSDKTKPIQIVDVTVDGSYLSSRMIDDYIYAVVNKPAQVANNDTVNLPVIQVGNNSIKVAAQDVYSTGLPDYSYSFTSVIAINMNNKEQKPTIESFLLGFASTIYVSTESIYLTSFSFSAPYGTRIYKINVKDATISLAASGSVAGYVLNQFSMDEYKGFFRVATSDGKSTGVYVFDENLVPVGKLEGLAPNEDLHSARFMGDRCYLITFEKVDPLFVIDLKEPTNPQVLGLLKVPGYSDYLHPYDENHLIGIGKETVDLETGVVLYQGVKISLFDVSNISQPKEIDKFEIGDRGTDSLVLRDHKAFLFSRSKNLLVLPILLAEAGDFVWQGAYIFNITLKEGLEFRGGITHIEDATELTKFDYYSTSPYEVKRALYIDNVLYTISDAKVKLNNLQDLTQIAEIKLQ